MNLTSNAEDGRTSRIRRRRGVDVADTTDSLRAVACIRFVRPVVGCHAVMGLGLMADEVGALSGMAVTS
jgi:hypothetical protein